MKKAILLVFLLAIPAVAHADEYVQGYYRSNGTYVQPYMRSSPDGNPYNNFSARGNVNPYTGQPGTVNPNSNSYGGQNYGPYQTFGTPAYTNGFGQ